MKQIPPAGDFRPYLHIHDHDFSLLINSNKPQAGVVIGVTVGQESDDLFDDVSNSTRTQSSAMPHRIGQTSYPSHRTGQRE
jgi:hypothetical protein